MAGQTTYHHRIMAPTGPHDSLRLPPAPSLSNNIPVTHSTTVQSSQKHVASCSHKIPLFESISLFSPKLSRRAANRQNKEKPKKAIIKKFTGTTQPYCNQTRMNDNGRRRRMFVLDRLDPEPPTPTSHTDGRQSRPRRRRRFWRDSVLNSVAALTGRRKQQYANTPKTEHWPQQPTSSCSCDYLYHRTGQPTTQQSSSSHQSPVLVGSLLRKNSNMLATRTPDRMRCSYSASPVVNRAPYIRHSQTIGPLSEQELTYTSSSFGASLEELEDNSFTLGISQNSEASLNNQSGREAQPKTTWYQRLRASSKRKLMKMSHASATSPIRVQQLEQQCADNHKTLEAKKNPSNFNVSPGCFASKISGEQKWQKQRASQSKLNDQACDGLGLASEVRVLKANQQNHSVETKSTMEEKNGGMSEIKTNSEQSSISALDIPKLINCKKTRSPQLPRSTTTTLTTLNALSSKSNHRRPAIDSTDFANIQVTLVVNDGPSTQRMVQSKTMGQLRNRSNERETNRTSDCKPHGYVASPLLARGHKWKTLEELAMLHNFSISSSGEKSPSLPLRSPRNLRKTHSVAVTSINKEIQEKQREKKAVSKRKFGDLNWSGMNALNVGWKCYQNTGHAFVNRRILDRLEVRAPQIREIFFKAAFLNCFDKINLKACTINDHFLILKQFWEDLIMNVADAESCQWNVREIGRHHAMLTNCGFSVELWEDFGEAAIEVIAGLEGMGSNKEACRSWRITIACVTDNLRRGFEQEVRNIKAEQQAKINEEYLLMHSGRSIEALNDVKL